MNKPVSPSAERNKDPILSVLKNEILSGQKVLEIGSGTGQHACFIGGALPAVQWQPTELAKNLEAINLWLAEANLSNVLEPIVLDVDRHPWPDVEADVCFTCNTLHIISIHSVRSVFKGAARTLSRPGKLVVYGPFTIAGCHTSDSNESFDQWLQDSDPASGVRDITELDQLAVQSGFSACRQIEMPANNFMLIWEVTDNVR